MPPERVVITHPEKIVYPDLGITKGEVADFYRRIAPRLLPHLRDRPATLERFPEGVGPDRPHFYQKDVPAHAPDWVRRIELPSERGKKVHYALIDDLDTLLYFVNQNALVFHVWLSRVPHLDRPDFVLFDLDPGEADFAAAVTVATCLHRILKDEQREAFLKTSGKTGLHILVPWTDEGGYTESRNWARSIADRVVAELPDLATLEIRKAERGGRVYVDVVQNAQGHHVVPAYVLRAVPEASVSTPLHWRELKPDLDPRQFNLRTLFDRLKRQRRDPLESLLPGAQE
jgi:bifunctional non-homologous end joining protein LigD